jgi:alkylation response protein AidB-like acyl-CoA dehydrogenase
MKSNFFTPSRQMLIEHLEIEPIVRDLENEFSGTDENSLRGMSEARTWYNMVLANAGDICANFIAPRAAAVDEKGATFENGEVHWASETKENMDVLARAGYMGGTLPRKYGGLNLPVAVNNVIVEMVSQADASLMNLFGLQDIAVTVSKFGDEAQRNRILPKFCKGEVSGSMALTEPEAGSDLQAVGVRAIERDGKWYLDGVKRFITNGCGEVSLVLARSEKDTKGGRGLSMFLYEREKHMTIRRIEEKLGIHGSPTCEIQFDMAPCELVGKRKFGLIKYVMSLMDGARLAVSSQALGIAQAAFDEAVKYANQREQFGKPIVEFPAVYQMLKHMQAEIETTRVLLYRTGLVVDYLDMYERQAEHGKDVRAESKAATALASLLTPLTKFTATEMSNKVAYDALQIHGGCGYMKDFAVERLSRDARITNIYEGTTQLQVVAAINGVLAGTFQAEMASTLAAPIHDLCAERDRIRAWTDEALEIFAAVRASADREFTDYVANYLVEMASLLYRSALYLGVAEKHQSKRDVLAFFLGDVEVRLSGLGARVKMLQRSYGQGTISALKTDFKNG